MVGAQIMCLVLGFMMKFKWQFAKELKKMSVISLEEARKKRAKTLASGAELTPTLVSDAAGQQPTDNDRQAMEILGKAHFEGFTTKSDIAREHADVVAMLACCGLITTGVANDWTNFWKITPPGLQFLCDVLQEIDDDKEE